LWQGGPVSTKAKEAGPTGSHGEREVGQKLEGAVVNRVAAYFDSLGAEAHSIDNHVLVERVASVDWVSLHDRQLHVVLLPSQEIDGALELPMVPLLKAVVRCG
jgi:hypothetical protein